MTIKKYMVGTTIRFTWISSGVTPSDIFCSIYDKNETSIDSGTMVNSGGGHYYHEHTVPNTPGYYVGISEASINGLPYRKFEKYQAIKGEV